MSLVYGGDITPEWLAPTEPMRQTMRTLLNPIRFREFHANLHANNTYFKHMCAALASTSLFMSGRRVPSSFMFGVDMYEGVAGIENNPAKILGTMWGNAQRKNDTDLIRKLLPDKFQHLVDRSLLEAEIETPILMEFCSTAAALANTGTPGFCDDQMVRSGVATMRHLHVSTVQMVEVKKSLGFYGTQA